MLGRLLAFCALCACLLSCAGSPASLSVDKADALPEPLKVSHVVLSGVTVRSRQLMKTVAYMLDGGRGVTILPEELRDETTGSSWWQKENAAYRRCQEGELSVTPRCEDLRWISGDSVTPQPWANVWTNAEQSAAMEATYPVLTVKQQFDAQLTNWVTTSTSAEPNLIATQALFSDWRTTWRAQVKADSSLEKKTAYVFPLGGSLREVVSQPAITPEQAALLRVAVSHGSPVVFLDYEVRWAEVVPEETMKTRLDSLLKMHNRGVLDPVPDATRYGCTRQSYALTNYRDPEVHPAFRALIARSQAAEWLGLALQRSYTTSGVAFRAYSVWSCVWTESGATGPRALAAEVAWGASPGFQSW